MKVTLKLGNVFVSHNPQLEITQSLTRRAGLTTNQFDKIKTTLESIAKNLSRYGLPADKINISLDLQVGVSATEDTTSIGIDREAKTITVALSLADSHARSEQDIEEKLVNVAVVLSNMLVKSSEKESSRLIPFQTELEQFYKENQGVEGLIDQYNFCLSLDQLQTDFKLYQVAFDLVSPNIDAAPYCEAKVNSLLTMIKQIEKKLPAPHPFEQLTDLAFFAALAEHYGNVNLTLACRRAFKVDLAEKIIVTSLVEKNATPLKFTYYLTLAKGLFPKFFALMTKVLATTDSPGLPAGLQ